MGGVTPSGATLGVAWGYFGGCFGGVTGGCHPALGLLEVAFDNFWGCIYISEPISGLLELRCVLKLGCHSAFFGTFRVNTGLKPV